MSTTITGVGSGFDIDSWVSQLVSAKETSLLTPLQTKLTTLQNRSTALSELKGKYSTLQSALQTFTRTIYDSTTDMWCNTKINSSNSAYATATSSGSVGSASIELQIEQVATATSAKSINSLGTISKTNIENAKFTNLANGQATAGNFTMFLNGKEYEIEIESNDTVKNVMDKIYNATDGKIQASVDDNGNFSIKAYKKEIGQDGTESFVADESAVLSLGSSSDESNLAAALKLHDKEGTYSYTSSYPVSTVNTKAAMASAESGLGEIKFFDENGNPAKSGTITINGVDFEIDENTSLNTLISRINGNSEANVKASYDSLTNKLILTSTETGQNNISLTESGTNLLNVLGFTTGEGENEILAEGSQTLGQNAIVYINGNKVISTSNTITGESSGIANLSITVKKPTSDYSNNKDDEKNITLDIEPDFTKVKEALTKFVDAYNDVVATTKSMSGSDGAIGHDSTLNSILSSMRGLTSDVSNNDGMYTMLAQIGISASSADTTKLTIDEKKLDEALTKNFDSVKLLLSDGYTSKTDNGLFDKLLADVSSVLDIENGYFSQKTTSIDSQIKSMNDRIERANTKIANYEARITKQFNAMDSTISALSAQLTTFQSYFG